MSSFNDPNTPPPLEGNSEILKQDYSIQHLALAPIQSLLNRTQSVDSVYLTQEQRLASGTPSESRFIINYLNEAGNQVPFVFALPPAIESHMNTSNMGQMVPEAKPGILWKTDNSIKKFNIPGSAPVFQSLGIEHTILQLVGAFIGNELQSNSTAANGTPITPTVNSSALYSRNASSLNSYQVSRTFDTKIVQANRPVTVSVYSATSTQDSIITFDVTALIQGMRYFMRRADRTFYALDFVVLDYNAPSTPSSSST